MKNGFSAAGSCCSRTCGLRIGMILALFLVCIYLVCINKSEFNVIIYIQINLFSAKFTYSIHTFLRCATNLCSNSQNPYLDELPPVTQHLYYSKPPEKDLNSTKTLKSVTGFLLSDCRTLLSGFLCLCTLRSE